MSEAVQNSHLQQTVNSGSVQILDFELNKELLNALQNHQSVKIFDKQAKFDIRMCTSAEGNFSCFLVDTNDNLIKSLKYNLIMKILFDEASFEVPKVDKDNKELKFFQSWQKNYLYGGCINPELMDIIHSNAPNFDKFRKVGISVELIPIIDDEKEFTWKAFKDKIKKQLRNILN